MTTVRVDCAACGGSGVYRGMAEPPGVAVVCLSCDGSGFRSVAAFEGLKRREGIRTVRRSRGRAVFLGVGPTGGAVSYEAFLRGERP